jgi:integrase
LRARLKESRSEKQSKRYADQERGIFYRKAIGKRTTRRRQMPAQILPRLIAHLRRWRDRKLIAICFVGFNSKPVASVKKGFKSAVGLAGLASKVTPHILLHTAATCADLGRRRVPGHVCGGPAGHLWTSSTRRLPLARSGDTFRGSNRRLTREQPAIRTKNLMKTWSEW